MMKFENRMWGEGGRGSVIKLQETETWCVSVSP